MAKNKHLTDSERLQIEQWLRDGHSLKKIAEKLGKATSTISREVRARALPSDKGAPYRLINRCKNRRECQKRQLCEDRPDCTKKCSLCKLCNNICEDFWEEVCHRLHEPPYVCNGCIEEMQCVLRKRFYLHKKAHEAYREKLVESRVGVNITEEELLKLDETVSPLVRRGQSVHHIFANNPDDFSVSEKSVYRYISGGLLKAKNIDMPRVVRLRPRKTKPVEHKVDSGCRIGRMYSDYNVFIENTGVQAVEMDSVIGRIGGKVLLTMIWKPCDLMLAFIRDRNTSQSVIDTFDMLYTVLGAELFKEMFPVCLADNGSEFSNPTKLEFDSNGTRRTWLFYCDPYSSFQKPKVEVNHEFIRRVLPKGTSFDNLTQDDINLMMSHINSYSRERLNDKAPYDLFGFLYGCDVLEKLGLSRIPSLDILLKPSLLKK